MEIEQRKHKPMYLMVKLAAKLKRKIGSLQKGEIDKGEEEKYEERERREKNSTTH